MQKISVVVKDLPFQEIVNSEFVICLSFLDEVFETVNIKLVNNFIKGYVRQYSRSFFNYNNFIANLMQDLRLALVVHEIPYKSFIVEHSAIPLDELGLACKSGSPIWPR